MINDLSLSLSEQTILTFEHSNHNLPQDHNKLGNSDSSPQEIIKKLHNNIIKTKRKEGENNLYYNLNYSSKEPKQTLDIKTADKIINKIQNSQFNLTYEQRETLKLTLLIQEIEDLQQEEAIWEGEDDISIKIREKITRNLNYILETIQEKPNPDFYLNIISSIQYDKIKAILFRFILFSCSSELINLDVAWICIESIQNDKDKSSALSAFCLFELDSTNIDRVFNSINSLNDDESKYKVLDNFCSQKFESTNIDQLFKCINSLKDDRYKSRVLCECCHKLENTNVDQIFNCINSLKDDYSKSEALLNFCYAKFENTNVDQLLNSIDSIKDDYSKSEVLMDFCDAKFENTNVDQLFNCINSLKDDYSKSRALMSFYRNFKNY